MKLCADCHWLRRKAGWELEFSECGHPSTERAVVSRVTGTTRITRSACDMYRAGECGEEGKFWEPKDGDQVSRPAGFV